MKHLLIGLAIMCVIILSFMAGYRLLTRHIFDRTDCERFNIDNIELRTGINIPVVDDVTCDCGEGYKKSSFVLDTKHVDVKDYASKNEFELKEGVYVAQGDDQYTKWEASLETNSNKLTIYMEYKAVGE